MPVAACVFLFNSGGHRAELNNTMTTIAEHTRSRGASEQVEKIGREKVIRRERERERERNASWRQLYGGVENKQITDYCHKHSGLVISSCQEGFPKLPRVHREGCPIAYLPLRDSARSVKVRHGADFSSSLKKLMSSSLMVVLTEMEVVSKLIKQDAGK